MKKKLKLTFIYFLATIVFILVSLSIVFLVQFSINNNSRRPHKNSFATETKELFKTAQQQWMMESMTTVDERVYARKDGLPVGNYKELDMSGRTDVDYYIKVSEKGNIIELYVTDGIQQFVYKGERLNIEDIGSKYNDEVISEIPKNKVIEIDDNGMHYKSY